MILDLESMLRCPECRASPIRFASPPVCGACGWSGRVSRDIPDFVDPSHLSRQHNEELAAQENAVEDYYENEQKVSCHWDRMSADELPPLLGYPAGPVLDLGCGTGSAGAAVRRTGAAVVGVDLTLACLEVARRRLDAVVRAEAAHLPFKDEAFDAVIARGALHHMADARSAMREIARVLRRGGRALLVDPREFPWLEPVKHAIRKDDSSFTEDHHAYTIAEYRALVEEHLAVDKVLTFHAFAIMIAVGLDLVPLPSWLPKRMIARGLYKLDRALDKTPVHKAGHLVAVCAHKN
jgi:ubiquinone/menaquinone biosynthesis C-methylase UbiE